MFIAGTGMYLRIGMYSGNEIEIQPINSNTL